MDSNVKNVKNQRMSLESLNVHIRYEITHNKKDERLRSKNSSKNNDSQVDLRQKGGKKQFQLNSDINDILIIKDLPKS